MDNNSHLLSLQRSAIAHGGMAIFIGLLSGIALTYSALSEVSLWPLYTTSWTMPGDTALWRAAHTGSILNGLMCILVALSLNYLNLSQRSTRNIVISLIVMVWGNIAFYLARIWGNNRGLALKSEQFGDGNIFDVLSMIPAFVAMLFTFYAVALLVFSAYHSKVSMPRD